MDINTAKKGRRRNARANIRPARGGSWRVHEMTLTIDTVGEHTITLGNLTKTINIVE